MHGPMNVKCWKKCLWNFTLWKFNCDCNWTSLKWDIWTIRTKQFAVDRRVQVVTDLWLRQTGLQVILLLQTISSKEEFAHGNLKN